MADYQRQANTLVTFRATTNATSYQWKIDNVIASTDKTFQKTFTELGFHTIEFIGMNTCGDQCIQTIRLQVIPAITPNQRTVNTPVTFKATTNATNYQWKINGIVASTEIEFQKIFISTGHYSLEFTGSDSCGNICTKMYDLEIVPYPVTVTQTTIGETDSQIIMGNYMTETTTVQTPIYRTKRGTTERIAEESTSILNRLENIEKTMLNMMTHRINYNTHYYIDSSSTTRRKIDLLRDLGTPAVELFVVNEGGGFTLEINDEGYAVTPRVGFTITNENIERIYVAGSGITGTGRIRVGAWR